MPEETEEQRYKQVKGLNTFLRITINLYESGRVSHMKCIF